MSHHYSGPNWGFPYGDARLDLADLVTRGYLMKIGSNRGTYYIARE